MKESAATIVFLEFIDEAQKFLQVYQRNIKHNPSKFKIISFHPKVKAFLQNHGITCMDSYHYCPKESHQKLLIELERLTEEVRSITRIHDSQGIEDSYRENFIFTLRCLLSTWLYRVEVILNAIEDIKPRTVICAGPVTLRAVRSIWTEAAERYLADILRQAEKAHDFELRILPSNNTWQIITNNLSISFQARIKSVIGWIAEKWIRPSRNSILVPVNSHQIDVVMKDLNQRLNGSFQPAFIGFPKKNKLRELKQSLFNKKDYYCRYLFFDFDKKSAIHPGFLNQCRDFENELFKLFGSWHYRQVSVSSWLKIKYIKAILPGVIYKTYFQSKNISDYFKKWKPAFVMSQHARGIGAVVGELCRINDISSLMIPHGSFTEIPDEISMKEWRENALGIVDTPYRFLALQTPLIEDFLKDIPVSSQPIVTGPLIFARTIPPRSAKISFRRQFADDDEKIILHAGTPKHRLGQRFLHYETIDEYIDGIASLINAAEKIDKIKVLIRYRVIDGLNVEELKSILPASSKYEVVSAGDFSDVLSISDLLFSFSSSTMEEALQNNIPVLLFNKFNRYIHLKGEEFSKDKKDIRISAVYNVNDQEVLAFALEWITRHHLESRKNPDELFSHYKYKAEQIVPLRNIILNQNLTRTKEEIKI